MHILIGIGLALAAGGWPSLPRTAQPAVGTNLVVTLGILGKLLHG